MMECGPDNHVSILHVYSPRKYAEERDKERERENIFVGSRRKRLVEFAKGPTGKNSKNLKDKEKTKYTLLSDKRREKTKTSEE